MNSGMETMIAGVTLKNPVTTASGTFGSGREYGELIDLNRLGAITVKGVSEERKEIKKISCEGNG